MVWVTIPRVMPLSESFSAELKFLVRPSATLPKLLTKCSNDDKGGRGWGG